MSERKDTEIKIRLTQDEKARWQQLAEEREQSLSTLIRSTMNREVFEENVKKAIGTPFIPIRDDEHPGAPQEDVPSDEVGSNECDDYARCTADGCRGCREPITRRTAPGWTFEARNG